MIEIKQVSKVYHKHLAGKCQALHGVDLQLSQGEIVGLFGENGAGKTTLMKCILGLLSYDGQITLDGEPITCKNIARLSFATSEHSFFPNLTAKEHAEFYRQHFPKFMEKRFASLMNFFALPMKKPLRTFSTGQKNQFEVVLALCQGADYILMDEPFAGNDVFNREDFYKVLLGILEPNETVLLSTHLIDEVAGFISRAVLLRQGQIIGDVSMVDLEESGKEFMTYIKEMYDYRGDRIRRVLTELSEEG